MTVGCALDRVLIGTGLAETRDGGQLGLMRTTTTCESVTGSFQSMAISNTTIEYELSAPNVTLAVHVLGSYALAA